MEASKSRRVGSLLREFLVIFAGVLIALVADDWRTDRDEREQGVQSLRVVEEDLRSDSVELADVFQLAQHHAAASRWLFEHWSVSGDT